MWSTIALRSGVAAAILTASAPIASAHARDDDECALSAAKVADLESYASNAAYQNCRITLAAGEYRLTRKLVLQAGQSIVGQQLYVDRDKDKVWDPIPCGAGQAAAADPADPAACYATMRTVIDAGGVVTDFMEPPILLRTGNAIERVTIRGAGAEVEPRNIVRGVGPATSEEPIRLANVVFEDIGWGAGMQPTETGTYSFEAEGNVFHRSGGGLIVNTFQGRKVVIKATLRNNRITGNTAPYTIGLEVVQGSSNDSSTTVVSHGNIIDKNTTGVVVFGGQNFGGGTANVGSSRVDLQACKLEYSIVSPK